MKKLKYLIIVLLKRLSCTHLATILCTSTVGDICNKNFYREQDKRVMSFLFCNTFLANMYTITFSHAQLYIEKVCKTQDSNLKEVFLCVNSKTLDSFIDLEFLY